MYFYYMYICVLHYVKRHLVTRIELLCSNISSQKQIIRNKHQSLKQATFPKLFPLKILFHIMPGVLGHFTFSNTDRSKLISHPQQASQRPLKWPQIPFWDPFSLPTRDLTRVCSSDHAWSLFISRAASSCLSNICLHALSASVGGLRTRYVDMLSHPGTGRGGTCRMWHHALIWRTLYRGYLQ